MNFYNLIVLFSLLCLAHAIPRRRQPKIRPEGVNQRHNIKHDVIFDLAWNNNNCIYNLCTNISNYPSNQIKDMIHKKKEFHRFFGSVIQPYEAPILAPKSSINSEDKNMCATQQYTYFPEIAINKNRKKVFIVNVDKFRQAVSFETCVPKAECFFASHKPAGYLTACKQQYNLIRLVSMADNGNFTLDTFPIPSSCVCTYRQTIGYTFF